MVKNSLLALLPGIVFGTHLFELKPAAEGISEAVLIIDTSEPGYVGFGFGQEESPHMANAELVVFHWSSIDDINLDQYIGPSGGNGRPSKLSEDYWKIVSSVEEGDGKVTVKAQRDLNEICDKCWPHNEKSALLWSQGTMNGDTMNYHNARGVVKGVIPSAGHGSLTIPPTKTTTITETTPTTPITATTPTTPVTPITETTPTTPITPITETTPTTPKTATTPTTPATPITDTTPTIPITPINGTTLSTPMKTTTINGTTLSTPMNTTTIKTTTSTTMKTTYNTTVVTTTIPFIPDDILASSVSSVVITAWALTLLLIN